MLIYKLREDKEFYKLIGAGLVVLRIEAALYLAADNKVLRYQRIL